MNILIPQKQSGFTIIELTIVISIVSLLFVATIVWPGKGINLNAETQQLMANIRYTQFLAMSRNTRYRINFSENSYTLTEADGTTHIDFPVNTQGDRHTILLDENTTLETDLSALIFDGKGIPYDETETALMNEEIVTLTAEGYARIITITPETGMINL